MIVNCYKYGKCCKHSQTQGALFSLTHPPILNAQEPDFLFPMIDGCPYYNSGLLRDCYVLGIHEVSQHLWVKGWPCPHFTNEGTESLEHISLYQGPLVCRVDIRSAYVILSPKPLLFQLCGMADYRDQRGGAFHKQLKFDKHSMFSLDLVHAQIQSMETPKKLSIRKNGSLLTS